MSRLLSGRRASINTSPNTPKKSNNLQKAPEVDGDVSAPRTNLLMDSFQEKQVQFLQQKLERKLPCNSGLSLIDVEGDPIAEKLVDGFIDLGINHVDISVMTLCSMFEKLQHRAFPDGTLPEQVLDTHLYILKVITRVLYARWPSDPLTSTSLTDLSSSKSPPTIRHVASASTSFLPGQQSHPRCSRRKHYPSARPSIASLRSISTATSTSSHEPGPLEETTIVCLFRIISEGVTDVNDLSESPEMFPWSVVDWEPAFSSPSRPPKHPTRTKGGVKEDPSLDPVDDGQSRSTSPLRDLDENYMDVQNGHARLSANRSIFDKYGRCQYTIYTHKFTRDEELHGSYLASVPVLIRKYICRIFYSLSASNWPYILAIVKGRLKALTEPQYGNTSPLSPSKISQISIPLKSLTQAGSYSGKTIRSLGSFGSEKVTSAESSPATNVCHQDLRLISACIMDRTRLISILQEYTIVFREIPLEAQEAAGLSLRNAILHWVNDFPGQFADLWAGNSGFYSPVRSGPKRKMLEGIPEHLFDIMFEQVRENNRRAAVLYPALTALICISPDRFNIAINAMEHPSNKISVKMNFLQQLRQALRTSPRPGSPGPNIAEQASFAYLDLIRLSFSIPPHFIGEYEPSIKNAGAERAAELKRYLLQPPAPRMPFYASADPIDVNFYAYCIAAIYRFHPNESLQLMEICFEPERSYAVKQCVVKALILLVVEAPIYTWQPSLDIAFPVLAPRFRKIIRSCLFNVPEIVNGQTLIPAPLPVCKALAKARDTNSSMADVINEQTRLLLQIQTLRPLEPSFWVYGATRSSDYAPISLQEYREVETGRDPCEQAALTLGQTAVFARLLNISTKERCHHEAEKYLYFCAPYALMIPGLMILYSPDDREMQRLGVLSLHDMLGYLAHGSMYDKDATTSWRFSPQTVKILDFVELTLWVVLPSVAMDISAIAQDCLRLINIWERDPAVSRLPLSHFSGPHFSTRCAMIEGLCGTQEIITGRQAFQKRLRKQGLLLTHISPVQLVASSVIKSRFTVLASRMEQLPADQITAYNRHEDFQEWQNTLYLLTSGASVDLQYSNEAPASEVESLLHPNFAMPSPTEDPIRKLIGDIVRLLASRNVHARESAKEALGNQLNITAIPVLLECLDVEIRKWLAKEDGTLQIASELIFVEQCLSILKMVFDRLDGSMAIFENRTPENCLAIGNFITDYPVGDDQSRLKIRFSAMISLLLSKRHCFAIRDENGFRSQLSDLLVTWVEQHMRAGVAPSTYPRLTKEAQIATIKLLVLSLEKLTVLPSNPSRSIQNTIQAVSQKACHYISTLLSTLYETKSMPITSPTPSAHSFASKMAITNDTDLIHELVVGGISNIVNNNSEACKQLCISRCYDENPDVRIVFMQAFTRVFGLGFNFDQSEDVTSNDQQDPICQLIRESQILALCVVEACPASEVETMVPVLTRLFDTPETLVRFLKAMIDREIVKTVSPSELLRSNNICTRMLSIIARQHGYSYLRANMEFLVNNLAQTTEYSYETDPARTSTEEATRNVEVLVRNADALLSELLRTIDQVPYVIREMSRHILNVVSRTWPESRYPALGAFIFLRLIVPAIASPDDAVNIILSDDEQYVRRGLLMIAKILQSLSNQMSFGQSPVVREINQFLEDNVQTMVDYLIKIQTVPSDCAQGADRSLYLSYDDADALIIHRFVHAHADKIGQLLLDAKESTRAISGKQAWDTLCATLVDTRITLEQPKLTSNDQTHHKAYQQFMCRNKNRNTDTLAGTCTLHVGTEVSVFVLTLSAINVDVVDFELLLFLIFKTLNNAELDTRQFDVIFDFTAFTSRSVLPTAWLKLAIELLPDDIRKRWRACYMLNLNGAGRSFLRRVSILFSGLKLVEKVVEVSSITQLRQYFPNIPSLCSTSVSMSVQNESSETYNSVHYQLGNQPWSLGTLYVDLEYIRIVSVKHNDAVAYTTEFIGFRDVEDVYKGDNGKCVFLRHSHRELSAKFETASRDSLLNVIQGAKQGYARSNKSPLLLTAQSSDTSATLLAIGLFHACSNSLDVRNAAYDLLAANCTYLGYPLDDQIPWRSSYVPSNVLAFVNPFAERISAFAPQMTLDFVLEWAGTFSRGTINRKTICLQYLTHWIRHLERFIDPSKACYDDEKVRKCIRVLLDVTVQNPEIYPTSQRFIWLELAKCSSSMLNLVLDELIATAINHGLGSERCGIIADTLITLSTVFTRNKLLTELRTHITNACNKPTKIIMEANEWNTISVLSYLSMVAGHNPRLTLQNQLYAPTIAHIISMLAGIGPLLMRMAIYGLTTNLLQALHSARKDNEAAAIQLRNLMAKLAQPEFLKLFGLCRPYPSSQIGLLDEAATEISADALEGIAKLLRQALDLGSSSVGLNNTWNARWMSFLSTTVFQPATCAQYRGFTILSCLAESDITDDLFNQILDVFVRNIQQSDRNAHASEALLRCVCRLVPGLDSESRYLPYLFWLAVSLLQTNHLPFRVEATQLLQACIETMDKHGVFDHGSPDHEYAVVAVLMNARKPISAALEQVDHLSEISFRQDFGFALIASMWYNVRNRNDITLLREALMSVIKVFIKSANPTGKKRASLDSLIMPLFLGLAPCMDKIAYKRFLEDECHISSPSIIACSEDIFEEEEETVYLIDSETMGIHNNKSALLAVGFLACAGDNHALNLKEQENTHYMWGMLANSHPKQLAAGLWHNMEMLPVDSLSNKMDSIFSVSLSKAHLAAVSATFDVVMNLSSTQSTSNGTSNRSSSSLDSSQSQYSDGKPELSLTAIYRNKFIEMGMRGLLEPFRRAHAPPEHKVDPARADQMLPALIYLVESIQKSYRD